MNYLPKFADRVKLIDLSERLISNALYPSKLLNEFEYMFLTKDMSIVELGE